MRPIWHREMTEVSRAVCQPPCLGGLSWILLARRGDAAKASPQLHFFHARARYPGHRPDRPDFAEARAAPGGRRHRRRLEHVRAAGGALLAHAVPVRAAPGQAVRSVWPPARHSRLAAGLWTGLFRAGVRAEPRLVFHWPDNRRGDGRQLRRRRRLYRGHKSAGEAGGEFWIDRRGLRTGVHCRTCAGRRARRRRVARAVSRRGRADVGELALWRVCPS